MFLKHAGLLRPLIERAKGVSLMTPDKEAQELWNNVYIKERDRKEGIGEGLSRNEGHILRSMMASAIFDPLTTLIHL